MATIKPFSIYDLLEYNYINLDILTETFSVNFYGKYIAKWPEYCVTLKNSTEEIHGYLMGKVEGDKPNNIKKNWHGHVTAITVSPNARRQGIGRYMMNYLEAVTNDMHNGWFVDLFVRAKNKVAIDMYRSLGYDIYQTVYKYYASSNNIPAEDSCDMRKSMKRDLDGITSKPTGKVIKPSEIEFH